MEETFKINDNEVLTVADLDSWLDNLQQSLSINITVIYDACQSGSFIPELAPPEGKDRILIASTAINQSAYFLSAGDISFSKFFWWRVLNGTNIRNAYLHARKAIEYVSKYKYGGKITAQIDDNGNGISNEKRDGLVSQHYTIGVGIMLAGDDPMIGAVSPEQILNGESSAAIWAENVTTTGSIERVWATITPPGGNQNPPDTPVTDLQSINLNYNEQSERYEGIHNDFSLFGTHNIAVFAMDLEGNISMPMTTSIRVELGWEAGDINGNGNVDLIDAIIALKLLAGLDTRGLIRSNYITSGVDVNGDNNVGMEEIVYAFQKISK